MSSQVFISFGANMGNCLKQIRTGLFILESSSEVDQLICSSIYQTPAIGPEQPPYLNGVAQFNYKQSPLELLDLCQEIERSQGRDRNREIRWGPRPLDFDILLFGTREHQCERLKLPHPRMLERAFVLIPLSELAPHMLLSNNASVQATSQLFNTSDIHCLYNR